MAAKLVGRARYSASSSLLTSRSLARADSGRTCLPEILAAERPRWLLPGHPRNVLFAALSLVEAGIWSTLHGHAAPGPPPPNAVRMSRAKDPLARFRPGYANHGHPGPGTTLLPAGQQHARPGGVVESNGGPARQPPFRSRYAGWRSGIPTVCIQPVIFG